jgi:hypothetical protein
LGIIAVLAAQHLVTTVPGGGEVGMVVNISASGRKVDLKVISGLSIIPKVERDWGK